MQILQNPPIIARYFAFQYTKTNQTQTVLYWYETSTFTTNNTAQQKHVKISLIVYPKTLEDLPEIENQLTTFGFAIANYWQPIKAWTQIALTISQNGPALTATTATLLAITLAYQKLQNRQEKKSNIKLYNKLSQHDKLIIQAAHRASKEEKRNANTIASHYQKLTGKPIESEPLIEKLNEAEKVGLIKRIITSQEDEPTLIWKSQVQI
jgi:hypothetical protein